MAAAAGVAASTVSNFFNHPEKLAKTTQERIQEAVGTLGFVPNNVARMLRTRTNPVIGYIASKESGPNLLDTVYAAEQRVTEEGMHLLMAHCGSEERERSYLRLFVEQRVAGIIIAPCGNIEEELCRIRDHGIPGVVVTRRATSATQASVSTDHVAGGRLAVEHLVEQGRRHLGFLTHDLEAERVQDQLRGALATLASAPGVALEVIRASEESSHAGAVCADHILQRPPAERPDGLFCANELLALGATRSFITLSPSDISLVGYGADFSPLAASFAAAVRIPYREMGEAAVDVLFDQLAQEYAGKGHIHASPGPHIEISPQIVKPAV
ncbi:LacI family DNA-binding transcriptional regulator [Streptomyces sp. NPDC048489]|uniref:LacI family DNA-binding transcriptional regulator n=1 Tax=Streptomyces sp. NPDC048489 TaxID=3154504 RepID=UPI003442B1D7